MTTSQINDCIALLTARRSTNGYATLADLRAAAKIPATAKTEEAWAARNAADLDLHEALTSRSDVSFRGNKYRLMA